MEFLHTTEVTIPIFQISLLLLVSTLVLLFGRVKLALIINYLFTLYWGYLANEAFMAVSTFNTMAYFGFGLLIVILALLGFFTAAD